MDDIDSVLYNAGRVRRFLDAHASFQPVAKLFAKARGISTAGRHSLLPKQVVPTTFLGFVTGYEIVPVGSNQEALERLYERIDRYMPTEEMSRTIDGIISSCDDLKRSRLRSDDSRRILERFSQMLVRIEEALREQIDARNEEIRRNCWPLPVRKNGRKRRY